MARKSRVEDSIKITISPLFGESKTLNVPKDSTVGDILDAEGYGDEVEVRLAGDGAVDTDTILEDGDEITVVSKETKVKAAK